MISRRDILHEGLSLSYSALLSASKIDCSRFKKIIVSNLNPDGDGSLKRALELNFPRKISFCTAGIIDLDKSPIEIRNPDLVMCGETAPSPGITIIKGAINISADNVMIRHICFRPGDAGLAALSGFEPDGISITAARNVHIENCSVSWAVDEGLSASGPRFSGRNASEWRNRTSSNIVFKNNIIAHSLNSATHSKGPHSMGSLIHDNVTNVQIIGNLYANNNERNPLLKGGTSALIANNVIYNPGNACVQYTMVEDQWAGHIKENGYIDLVGNILVYGPDTKAKLPMLKFGGCGDLLLYHNDNRIENSREFAPLIGFYQARSDGYEDASQYFPKAAIFKMASPKFKSAKGKIIASTKVEDMVYKTAGARYWDRNQIDKEIIFGAKTRTGKIINSQTEVGGYGAI